MVDIILSQDYPGGVMRQLGDLVGGIEFNQYAPGGVIGQLIVAAGLAEELDQYAPGGALARLVAGLETPAPPEIDPEAPTFFDIQWVDWAPDGVNGTYAASLWAAPDAEVVLASFFGAVEPQGEEVTYALVPPVTGLSITGTQLIGKTADGFGTPGTFPFTVRCSDPGGHYLDQDYTVMVTA